jgi:hypothetical protein
MKSHSWRKEASNSTGFSVGVLEKYVESVISRNKVYICLQVILDIQKPVVAKLNENDYNDRRFKLDIYLL